MAKNLVMGDIKRIQAYQKDMKKRVEPQKESILKTFQKAIEAKRRAIGSGMSSVGKNIANIFKRNLSNKIISPVSRRK